MKITLRHSVINFLLVLLILPMLLIVGSSEVAQADDPPGPMPPEQQIILRADPTYNPHRVPAPPPRDPDDIGVQAASFNIHFDKAGCTGGTFSDWPQAAKDAFNYGANQWAALLNGTVTINIHACWQSDLPSGVLGGASHKWKHSTQFNNAPVANTWYPSGLADQLHGSDTNPGQYDIDSTFSSTFPWYFGTDGNTPFSQYDFASVVMHEIGHGLGFDGTVSYGAYCGGAGLGCWGSGFMPQDPGPFDRFAEDGNTLALLNYTNFSTALGNALTGQVGGGVYFDGPNANAANGGNRVKLYTPSTWQYGSSYAHLDEIFNNTPHALMTYSLNNGESAHHPGAVTLGIFQDTGWSVNTGEVDPFCPAIWSDDHEDGFSDWTVSNDGNGNDWQGKTDGGGYRGSNNYWFADDIVGPTDSYLDSSTITATINDHRLQFFHKYNLQADANNGYDGGVVEINVNGGGWQDVGSANFTKNGYNKTINQNSSPIDGRQAFSGDSGDYIESIVDLSNLVKAGDTFQIRFREANDNATAGDGWYVDDVRVCGPRLYLPIVVKN